jgi:Predicted transcriptional regulator, contains C-terminal CBS domains
MSLEYMVKNKVDKLIVNEGNKRKLVTLKGLIFGREEIFHEIDEGGTWKKEEIYDLISKYHFLFFTSSNLLIDAKDLIKSEKAKEIEVGEVMNVEPIISPPEESVYNVLQKMRERDEEYAIIVCDSLPCGILDLFGVGKAILEGRLKESVMNFAERNFFKVTPESSLETARKLMISSSRFFLPVVDFRTLLGSVSWKEVFDNLNKEAYVS